MRYHLMLLTIFCIGCAASAQIKNGVIKSAAFFTEHSPGNIAVDENGNELGPRITIALQVFLEVKKDENFIWDTAWYNQKAYTIQSFKITEKKINVGVLSATGEPAFINTKSNNILLQLNFMPIDEPVKENNSKNLQTPEKNIVITGKYKGIAFSHNAGVPAQLEAIPSM